jgi:hypothetical protein
MKSALMILILVMAFPHNGICQYNKLKGSKTFQVGFGFHDAGLLVNAYSMKTFDQKIKAGFGGGFAFGNVSDIRYKAIFFDGIGTYALRSNRVFSINGVAGLSFIGDFKNEFASERYTKNFSFNYGVFGGGEMEFIASRKLSFVVGGTYRYYLQKDFGNRRYHLTAAMRVTL